MKKISGIVALTLVAFLLFSSTGYAKAVTKKITAIFGSYVIKVDKKTQKTVTLANGSSVYIPINEVTTLTGAKVAKSGTTYTISPLQKEDGITKKDIETLKYYSELQDVYTMLDHLGEDFFDITNDFDIVYREIDNTGDSSYFTEVLNDFNGNVEYYNDSLDTVDSLLLKAKQLNLYNQNDKNNLYEIQNLLSQSIDSYKLAFDEIDLYISNPNYHSDFANEKNAYKKALEARSLANSEYEKYFKLIQNYKIK
jgi:hypothetical protein